MQRRHFELIANVLKSAKPSPDCADAKLLPKVHQYHVEQWDRTVGTFAKALHSTNPNFNRDRFLKACGVPDA